MFTILYSKNLKLRNDFILDKNCSAAAYFGAKEKEKIFLGHYYLISKDTIRYINLREIFYNYKAVLFMNTINYTNEEDGNWNYDIEKKILTFGMRKIPSLVF